MRMLKTLTRILIAGIATVHAATLGARAAEYVVDNNSGFNAWNLSDGSEPRDNWCGIVFTAQAGGNLITWVDFGVGKTTSNMTASVVLYTVSDPLGNPALGATRVYTQAFVPARHGYPPFGVQRIPLSTGVLFNPGERFLVAVFMSDVIGAAPNDLYPYVLDSSGDATGSYWARSNPNTFDLDDLSGARPTSFLSVRGHWIIRAHGVTPSAAADYVLDDNTARYPLNTSDNTEPRDNWFGNVFTAQPCANLITRVDFGVATTTGNMPASLVLYRVTDPGGNPAAGATRVYTQSFTPLQHTNSANSPFVLQQIDLTTPVLFNAGDRFVVAVFMPNVMAAPPNDAHPYVLDSSGDATGSYWARSNPNTFNLDDLSPAKPIDQALSAGGWAPDPGHIILRAHGIDPNPAADYVLDNNAAKMGINASDAAEPRDNWFANAFTAHEGADLITRVDYGVGHTTSNMAASVVLYLVTEPFGNPALGATRVHTQAFSPPQNSGSSFVLQQIPLSNGVLFKPGDRFLVAVFMPDVVAAPPDDLQPCLFDTSGVGTDTYWARSEPNTFNLDDLRRARLIYQALDYGGSAPGRGHIVLRAHGVDSKALVLSHTFDGANLAVSFTSQRGAVYQLQSTTNLGDPHSAWSDEGSPLTGTGIGLTTAVPASGTTKFFRVRVQ